MEALGSKEVQDILSFWFGSNVEWRGPLWFQGVLPEDLRHISRSQEASQEATDRYIRSEFGALIDQLVDVETKSFRIPPNSSWRSTLQGRVAMIVLLDQFTRNAFRGTDKMFAYDSIARVIANGIFDGEEYNQLPWTHALFVCICLTHSEQLIDVNRASTGLLTCITRMKAGSARPIQVHDKAVAKLSIDELGSHPDLKRVENILKQTKAHYKLLQRFGRYPHRNKLLNRRNTKEEIIYLCCERHPKWVKSVVDYLPSPEERASVDLSAFEMNKNGDAKIVLQPMERGSRRYRLLILHGNKQNAEKFKRATSKAFRALEAIMDLHYMSATQPYVPQGRVAEALDGVDTSVVYRKDRNLVWFNASDDVETMEYCGLEESIRAVNDVCRRLGPFDGLLGFAQSACLAAIIAQLQYASSSDVQDCRFKFFILISGFCSRDVREQYNMDRKASYDPIPIPSFHCWGEKDSLVSPSRSVALTSYFKDPLVAPHGGGHFTGAVALWPVAQMVQWVNEVLMITPQHINIALPNASRLLTKVELPDLKLGNYLEKYDATLSWNKGIRCRGNVSVMWPIGLSNKLLTSTEFWFQLYNSGNVLYDACGISDHDVVSFMESSFSMSESAEELFDDLLLLSICVYPFELYAPSSERKKNGMLRLASQGEVFYWMFGYLLKHVHDNGPVARVGYHTLQSLLQLLLNSTGDWDCLVRINLLACTGNSKRHICGEAEIDDIEASISNQSESDTRGLYANTVQASIADIFASRLLKDENIINKFEKDNLDPSGESYDVAVTRFLDLSIKDKLQKNSTNAIGDMTMSTDISECAIVCPRWRSSIQKRTRLGTEISQRLYSAHHKELTAEFDIIKCRKEYLRLVAKLSSYIENAKKLTSFDSLSLLKAKEYQANSFANYIGCTDAEYQVRVVETPLSRAVLFPEPEPVVLSTAEELLPLHSYLQRLVPLSEKTANEESSVEDKVFTRGVICTDGRLDLCKQALGPKGIDSLFESLRYDQDPENGRHVVQHLLLGNNVCGDDLGPKVADHIAATNRIIEAGRKTVGFSSAPSEDLIFTRGVVCSDGRLDLCKQAIGPEGIEPLFKSLDLDRNPETGRRAVQHLLLGNNVCGDDLGGRVASYIGGGVGDIGLTTWYIAGNRLTVKGIRPICESLKYDNRVEQLWLKRNPLLPEGACVLSDMLKMNSHLIVLDLVNTGILDSGAITVLKALGASLSSDEHTDMSTYNQTLKHLYLDSNGLTVATAQIVNRLLVSGRNCLVTLSLGCNRLGDAGATLVADGMCTDRSIQRLVLSSAGICSSGAIDIGNMLRVNKSLLHLDLSMLKTTKALEEFPNRIGTNGSIAIASALEQNKTLRSLNLFYNNIFQAGVDAFRQILSDSDDHGRKRKVNTTLVRLDLEQMGIPYNELTREDIRLCLRRNYLNLSGEEKLIVDECLIPAHLNEVSSVYRVNGSYTKTSLSSSPTIEDP